MSAIENRGLKRFMMDITGPLPRMAENPLGAWCRYEDVVSILLKIKIVTDGIKERMKHA